MKHFWGGVALGDYRRLDKVIRQLPKSFSWSRRAHELWAMASTWNQKNTWGRAKLLIIQHRKENQEKCCSQFISVSLQSHPLNVTRSNVPSSKMFQYIQQKNVGASQGMDSDKTPWIYELCKKIKRTHPPDAQKSAGCHGQMQGQHSINCAGWRGLAPREP